MAPSISLLPVLWRIADQWVGVTGTNYSTLGNRAVFSSGVFDRLRAGKTITHQNFERLINWLAQPVNWPEGVVPEDCAILLHDMASIGNGALLSPGSCGDVSPDLSGAVSRSGAEGVAQSSATPERPQQAEAAE